MGRPTSSTTRGDPPDNRCGAPLAYRLALVARKGRCRRVPAPWQRGLGTIDPGPEGAVDALDVHRGGMLHQQLAALPTGGRRGPRYGSGLRAGRAVLGTPF